MKRIEECETVTVADRELLAEVRRRIADLLPKATALLYGSTARGQRLPDSDYDVLVLTSGKLTAREEDRVYDAVYDVALTSGVVVSVILYSADEWRMPAIAVGPFHANVEREGVLF